MLKFNDDDLENCVDWMVGDLGLQLRPVVEHVVPITNKKILFVGDIDVEILERFRTEYCVDIFVTDTSTLLTEDESFYDGAVYYISTFEQYLQIGFQNYRILKDKAGAFFFFEKKIVSMDQIEDRIHAFVAEPLFPFDSNSEASFFGKKNVS